MIFIDNSRMTEHISLIVNADDFGLNKEVNKGIIKAFRQGIVTSASLLVNERGFDDALAKIKRNRDLDVGLHLNIFKGEPITNLKCLVNKKGEFLENLLKFMVKFNLKKELAKKEILEEFEAQIKKAKDSKINFSHLDTEKHLHVIPEIFDIVCKLAKKNNISYVRFPFETKFPQIKPKFSQKIKTDLSNLFFNKSYIILDENRLLHPDYFYGISLSKNFHLKNLKLFLKNLKPGITELSCHPGFSPISRSYIDEYRRQELDVLINPEIVKLIKERHIQLINFKHIK